MIFRSWQNRAGSSTEASASLHFFRVTVPVGLMKLEPLELFTPNFVLPPFRQWRKIRMLHASSTKEEILDHGRRNIPAPMRF